MSPKVTQRRLSCTYSLTRASDDQPHKEMKELAQDIIDIIRGSYPKEACRMYFCRIRQCCSLRQQIEFTSGLFKKRYPFGIEEQSQEEEDVRRCPLDLPPARIFARFGPVCVSIRLA